MFISDFKSNYINLDKKFKILLIVFFLLPLSLIVGPATLEPLLFISSFIGIYLLYKKVIKFKFDFIIYILILLYLVSVISSLLSNDIFFSLRASLPIIRFFLTIIVFCYLIENNEWILKYFFFYIIILLSFVLIDASIQTLFGYNLLFLKSKSNYLITGFFGEEKVLGRYLMVLMSLSIGLYFSIFNRIININYFTLLIIFVNSILIFTSERLSMLYGFIIILFYIIYLSKINSKKYLLLLLIPIFIYLSFYKYSSENFFYNKIKDTFKQITDYNSQIHFYSKEHENFAYTSIELFKEKPMIGIGPKNFRNECDKIKKKYIESSNCSTHPHHNFFQILSEVGFIGCVIYLIIFLSLLKLLIKNLLSQNKKKIALIFFLLPTIFYINPILPSGNIFNNWNMMMGLITIPFYLVFYKKNEI